MANVYEGSIPQGGASLYPNSSSDQVDKGETPGGGGEGRVNATPGSAPTMNGSYSKQFVDESSYSTGDMNVDNDPAMKVRNPDDLSSATSGKMP